MEVYITVNMSDYKQFSLLVRSGEKTTDGNSPIYYEILEILDNNKSTFTLLRNVHNNLTNKLGIRTMKKLTTKSIIREGDWELLTKKIDVEPEIYNIVNIIIFSIKNKQGYTVDVSYVY